jgi:hypothetical protein
MPPPNLTGVLIGGRNDDNKPVGKSFLYSWQHNLYSLRHWFWNDFRTIFVRAHLSVETGFTEMLITRFTLIVLFALLVQTVCFHDCWNHLFSRRG